MSQHCEGLVRMDLLRYHIFPEYLILLNNPPETFLRQNSQQLQLESFVLQEKHPLFILRKERMGLGRGKKRDAPRRHFPLPSSHLFVSTG